MASSSSSRVHDDDDRSFIRAFVRSFAIASNHRARTVTRFDAFAIVARALRLARMMPSTVMRPGRCLSRPRRAFRSSSHAIDDDDDFRACVVCARANS